MATFVGVERLRNSVNGNGRFRLTTKDGYKVETATDSSCAYDVENAYMDLQSGAEVIAAVEYSKTGKLTRFTVIAVQERH